MLRRMLNSPQETFYIPEDSRKTFQSNMKDFVRNYFVCNPKTTSFTQLLKALQRVEGFQTATSREEQHRHTLLQQATERSGVWESSSDVENAD